MNKYLLYMILFFSIVQLSHSQEENGVVALALPVRNSLKFNKYVLNPTFSFVREQNKHITFTNKREWMQFENAPQTYLFSYSGRFSENSGLGVGLFQQNYGVMTTFGGIVNYAYNVVLDRDSNLTFGINLGVYQSSINEGKVITNFPDPSLDNIPSNTIITVNPGINYGLAFFDFGVSLNNLAAYNFATSNLLEDNPEQSVQAHIMYTGYVDSRGFFDETKFSGLLRSEFKKDQTVFSGIAMFTVPKGFWAQAGYNTLYGLSGGVGFNITSQIALEYNYEKAMGDLITFGSSHEITLAYKFKNRDRYNYSGDDEENALIAPAKKSKPAAKTQPTTRTVRNTPVDTTAEDKAKADEAARIQLEQAQAQAQADEAARIQLEQAQAQAKADEAARIKLAQAQTQAQADEAARIKLAQAQTQAQAAEAARIKLAQDQAKAQADEAARIKLAQEQAQAKAQADEAARIKLAQEQAQAKAQADEAARIKLAQEQAQAKAQADEAARIKLAQDQAKAQADEAARIKLAQEQAQAKAQADEAARIKLAQEQAQAKAQADEAARMKLAQEQAQAKAAEEARLKLEQEKLQREKDSIAQINLNNVVIEGQGSNKANISEPVTTLSEDSNIEQHELLIKLRDMVASKEQDLLDLKKENDLSERGIYSEPKPFKSVSAENAALESLKANLENVIKEQNAKIRQMEEVYSKNASTYADETIKTTYLNRLNALKAEQVQTMVAKDNLIASLNSIKEATEIERKRRIKRAVYDNEEDRLVKDRAALNFIKQNTPPSTVALTQNDFDFGEEQSKNIQILKGVNNVENGYYVVLAVHSDVAKRDDFLTKAVASGQKNINFFYDVNTSKYFIYYQKFESLDEANNALRSSNNEPYNAKKAMVKIEN